MLSLVSESLFNLIGSSMNPYFDTKVRFSPSLDHAVEWQKLGGSANLSPAPMSEDEGVRAGVLLLYKRSPMRNAENRRQRVMQVYLNTISQHDDFQLKDVIDMEVDYDCSISSRSYDHLEVFESLYFSRLRTYSELSIEVKVEDGLDPFPLYFSVTPNELSGFEGDDYDTLGSLWKLNFSVKVSGFVLTPDSSYIPKLLRIKNRVFVEGLGQNVHTPDTPDTNVDIWWKYKNVQDAEGRIIGNVLESRGIEARLM